MIEEKVSQEWNGDVEEVRNFLREYWVCRQMLYLRRYERKRWGKPEEPDGVEELLLAGETCWMARMREVEALVGSMRNGREKLVLYYHYIRGESIERASDLLGFSRRTGYRVHQRALWQISFLYARQKKEQKSIFSAIDV